MRLPRRPRPGDLPRPRRPPLRGHSLSGSKLPPLRTSMVGLLLACPGGTFAERIQSVVGGAAMPNHDWTKVNAGTWHDFHLAWIAEIRNALNGGLLPPSYYAQAEQIAGPMGPDVLTLQTPELPSGFDASEPTGGGLAVATAPPRAWLVDEAEMNDYVLKRRTLVIRHISGDRIVALIELVLPGNKAARFALRSFVEKAVEALSRGYHLLIVALFPPSPRDPQGIH